MGWAARGEEHLGNRVGAQLVHDNQALPLPDGRHPHRTRLKILSASMCGRLFVPLPAAGLSSAVASAAAGPSLPGILLQ
jgi:hypothetical protein